MMRIKMVVIVLLCCLWGSIGMANSKESDTVYRVVFSAFDVGSAGKYGYLQNSIQSMLVARLSANDRVEILEHTLSDKEVTLLKKGVEGKDNFVQPVEADYLLTGALFSLTTGLNVKVTLYPFNKKMKVYRFSFLIKDVNTLISKVENLSVDIAQKAFGYQDVEMQAATGGQKGDAAFVTVHPEAAYKRGVYAGTIITDSGVVKTVARGGKRTKEIAGDVVTMAVGDLDGDGKEEIAVLVGRKLGLYSLQKRTIALLAEESLPASVKVHAVNIADIDGDGNMEIFVSGTDGLYPSSMIMKWDKEKGLKTIQANIRWYLRPILLPEEGWILAGQQRGIRKIDLLRPGVYHLKISDTNKIERVKRLPLPANINLFDFIYADINGDGSVEIVSIDQKEKMRVYNQDQELTWVSDRNFGGSKTYIGPSQGAATDEQSKTGLSVDEDADRELIFVPEQLIAADLNGDGKQEIIVSEHEMSSLNYFYKLRLYKGGVVVGLAWNGAALQEVWRTGKYRGYLAGYNFGMLGEYKKNGQEGLAEQSVKTGRLYVSSIPNSGTIASFLPGTAESLLSVYDLDFFPGKSE